MSEELQTQAEMARDLVLDAACKSAIEGFRKSRSARTAEAAYWTLLHALCAAEGVERQAA